MAAATIAASMTRRRRAIFPGWLTCGAPTAAFRPGADVHNATVLVQGDKREAGFAASLFHAIEHHHELEWARPTVVVCDAARRTRAFAFLRKELTGDAPRA